MDFSTNLKTKHVSGVCECGNTFEGVVPHFVDVIKCDACVLIDQQQHEENMRLCAIRESAEHCGIPTKYREWDKSIAKELGSDKLLAWMAERGSASMWIGGTNGIGKTHTTLFRAYELLLHENIHSYCVRASSWLRKTVTERTKSKPSEKDYRRAIETRLLVFDDMGKERLSEARGELLYDIIDERDRRDLPIWITTNFKGKLLRERMNAASGEDGGHEYGYAIMKRLTRMIPKENIWK